MLKRRLLNLRKLWFSLLLMVGATAIAVPGIQEVMDGNVAKVGDTEYATLQAAVDAAQLSGGAQAITLIDNVSEEKVTIKEVANFQLVIDGQGKSFNGQIIVDGLRGNGGSNTNGASVILKNIAFFNDKAQDAILPSHYPHHLTIEDCTYTGSTNSSNNWFINISDGPLYGATIKNVTVKNSRLLQGNLGLDVVFESINATDGCTVGFNIKTEGTVLIKNCQITTAKYALRDYKEEYTGTITLENNTFISTSTESDEGAIVNRGGKVGTGHINVVSGSYTGAVKILNNKEGVLSITGGTFSEPVPASTLTEGYGSFGNADGTFTVKEGSAIAKIGDNKMYETLEAAFAAAKDGETITLLANCTGNGIKAPQGKFTTGLTVDFAGFTYTVDGSTVGSTGTETNGFQLLKDNKITFKGGTITSEKAKILIQNYSDLTLEGMTLTLNNANYTSAYTLSNNNGNIVIDGTTINANPAGGFAFDVCRYSSYSSVNVTVKGESVINGNIEVSASGNDAKDGFSLMLEAGTLNGNIVLDASAKAAMAATPEKATVSKSNSLESIAAPEEYKWKDNGNNTSSLVLKTYVAKIGDVQYETLADAVAAANANDVIEIIKAGEYTLPNLSKNVTIEGTVEGVVFNHTTKDNIASIPNGATFKNVTFNFGNNNYHGFQHAGTINMEGCTLNGKLFSYGDMNFTDCSFNQSNSDYHMWTYSGNVTYTGCTFTNEKTGKFLNVYNESGATKYTVTANNCKFVNNASAANKAAINVKATSGSNLLAYDVIINNCTTEGAFPEASESQALVVLKDLVQVDDRTADGVDKIKVYENDVLIYPVNYVAKIGNVKYETLEDAFAAAQDGETITLLADCTGNGIKAPQGKFTTGLTVDFAGFTYTVDGSTVGSTGTETNGFQLLKGNKITFKNGTITSEKAKILIQNYSDLTLEGMTLTLNNANYTSAYTLSNNNGNIVIDGTTINANPAGGFAFDVCRYSSYPSVGVTVKGESVINGNIEVSASGSDAKDGFSLMLESCTLTGEIVLDASAKAAMAATPEKATVSKSNSLGSITAPEEYKWKDNGNETSSLVLKTYVAKIGDVQYETLADAVAAVPADGTETTITMIADEKIDVVGYAVTIAANQNVVLDLAGHTVEGLCATGKTSALIHNLGTLKIEDSSDTNKDGSGNGKLTMSADPYWVYSEQDPGGYASNLIRNEKNLTIESGHLYNTGKGSATYGIDNYSAGNITINGGKVDAAKASAIRMFYVNGGSITVNEGVVGHYNSDDDCTYMGIQVMSGTNANVTINGGTIAGNYAFYANNTGGKISISDGTFDGYVGIAAAVPNDILSITGGAFNEWVGTWGTQTKFISGGIFAANDIVDEKLLADGYILSENTDEATKTAYPYAVREANYICAIGDVKYETLQDAVNAAGTTETTITLLTEAAADGVISGNGVKVPSGSNITFDLNGLTYDASGVTVGSTSTETQGFQLLKGSNITFKNGTLKATSPTAQMLIQNYSNLTLEDVDLDGTGLSGWAYALSNNCGTINLTGSTSITAKEGGRAFDTCKFGSYEIPTVNINTTGTISGTIEATGGKLNIENGKFNVTWVTDNNYNAGDIQIKGGVFTEEPAEEYCAEGYVPTDNTDEETKVQYPFAVMTKEDAGIFELIDGKVYPYLDYTEDKPAASVTYKRNFANYNWQALFIPFDINDVTKLTDKYEFAKVHMVALENDGTFTTGNKIEIYYTRVTSGKLSANQPYLIKLKNGAEQGWQDIVVENTILKDTHNMTPRKTSTMAADYYFTGTYEGYVGEKYHDFMAMGSGTINWGNKGHKLGTYRWYIKTVPYNDDYAKTTISFIEVDEEATGISAASTADNAEIEGYYTVNGVRSDVPVKGMNIVKYKNGKTKKIMIK